MDNPDKNKKKRVRFVNKNNSNSNKNKEQKKTKENENVATILRSMKEAPKPAQPVVASTTTTRSIVPFDPKKRFTQETFEDLVKSVRNYTLIGEGAYGQAYAFVYRGRAFVKKVSNIKRASHERAFYNEIETLYALSKDEKYFPFLYGHYVQDFQGTIFMEYISGFPLSILLREQRNDTRGLLSFEIEALIWQLKDAIKILHDELHILHLDLKPANIMVRFHQNVILGIVIIDFGFSRRFPTSNLSIQDVPFPGTSHYARPEHVAMYTKYKEEIIKTGQSQERYTFTRANNTHSVNIIEQKIRGALETDVDNKSKIGNFNLNCSPRFYEDSIEESLINSACIFANQGTESGLLCAQRILAIPGANLDINSQDSMGDTLLHSALYNNEYDIEVIKTLLSLGADITIENDILQIPMDILDNHITTTMKALSGPNETRNKNSTEYLNRVLQKFINTKALLENTSSSSTTTITSQSSIVPSTVTSLSTTVNLPIHQLLMDENFSLADFKALLKNLSQRNLIAQNSQGKTIMRILDEKIEELEQIFTVAMPEAYFEKQKAILDKYKEAKRILEERFIKVGGKKRKTRKQKKRRS